MKEIVCFAGIRYSEVVSIHETVQPLDERRNVLPVPPLHY